MSSQVWKSFIHNNYNFYPYGFHLFRLDMILAVALLSDYNILLKNVGNVTVVGDENEIGRTW